MSGEQDALLAELVGHGQDVRGKFRERIAGGTAGFAACVIAALVWNNDTEAGSGKWLDLPAPGIPEFREAVEENDDGAVWWAGGDGVEFARAVAKGQVFESGKSARHNSRVYP